MKSVTINPIDPIVEKVRQVRKELDKELEQDPKAFFQRINEASKTWGLKEAKLKPLQFPSTKTQRK